MYLILIVCNISASLFCSYWRHGERTVQKLKPAAQIWWKPEFQLCLVKLPEIAVFDCIHRTVSSRNSAIEIFVKVWINTGDIILIGLRDYQDTKADVIQKYSSDEARNLKAYGELPESGK